MLTFGRSSSHDVLRALKEKAITFAKTPLDTELANQCAIDAWSLCDWVFKEHGKRFGVQKLDQFQAQMKQQCPLLSLFQDVANASKHREITKYVPRLKEAKHHVGAFDRNSFQSSAFNVSALVLVDINGSEIWFDEALNDVINHWEHFFEINQIQ